MATPQILILTKFLLIFTIVFAILEKTRVLGTETLDGKKYSKKNLNSIVAFVIAFLVVASTKLVAVINQAMANVVLLLLLSFSFLMLVGSFLQEKEEGVFLTGFFKYVFMIIMFVVLRRHHKKIKELTKKVSKQRRVHKRYGKKKVIEKEKMKKKLKALEEGYKLGHISKKAYDKAKRRLGK